VPATGGPGALLVSPFNVKWRFSAPAGGVEGSKLFLFSVIVPAKCVSSISPRFHYRRLAFCFLPLATILESPRLADLVWRSLRLQGLWLIGFTNSGMFSAYLWKKSTLPRDSICFIILKYLDVISKEKEQMQIKTQLQLVLKTHSPVLVVSVRLLILQLNDFLFIFSSLRTIPQVQSSFCE
jgi:hypothetical protein